MKISLLFLSLIVIISSSQSSKKYKVLVAPLPSYSHFNTFLFLIRELSKRSDDIEIDFIVYEDSEKMMSKVIEFLPESHILHPAIGNRTEMVSLGQDISRLSTEIKRMMHFTLDVTNKKEYDLIIADTILIGSFKGILKNHNNMKCLTCCRSPDDSNENEQSETDSNFGEIITAINQMIKIYSYGKKLGITPNLFVPSIPEECYSIINLVKGFVDFNVNHNSKQVYSGNLLDYSFSIEKKDEELLKILNETNKKVLYISFGSVLVFEKNKIEALLETLIERSKRKNELIIAAIRKEQQEKLYEIIKRAESNDFFIVREWVNQKMVLNHEKVKVFLTHSGLNSIYEAINYETPMILFPSQKEQYFNSKQVVKRKMGERIMNIANKTEINYKLDKILEEHEKYIFHIKKIKEIIELNKGLDKAINFIKTLLLIDTEEQNKQNNYILYIKMLIVMIFLLYLFQKMYRKLCKGKKEKKE